MQTIIKRVFGLAILGMLLCPLFGQTSSPAANPQRREPCWREAGITRAAMQQRREIAESMRGQMESVCNDSSLSPAQKQQQLHELREQEQSRINEVITPEQAQALRNCQARGHAAAAPVHRGGNPCGMSSANGEHGPRSQPGQAPEGQRPSEGPDED